MRLVLDAGALIGIDRADRRVAGLIELGRRAGADLTTSSVTLAQAWRDGGRQARLARALPMIEVLPVTIDDAKRAGELLATAGLSDVVDSLLALMARPADQVLTSDPVDIRQLLAARNIRADVISV